MLNGNIFSKIVLNDWRQFSKVEIDFHDKITVLTGANGSGKSTILKILKSYFLGEGNESFLATPVKSDGKITFSFGNLNGLQSTNNTNIDKVTIGYVHHSDGTQSELYLPNNSDILYKLVKSTNNLIDGVSVESHRPLAKYEKILSIPISGTAPKEAFIEYNSIQKNYYNQTGINKGGTYKHINPIYSLKEMLISFATFGIGNDYVSPDPELEGLFDKFQHILRTVLPSEVGFQELKIQIPEVVISSASGDFPIDAASGGLMSIIQLSWQLFLISESASGRFVVLIDEPENHLHPSMQRTFLSNVVAAFPMAQFIVATHSPFIISSVKDSTVYALRHHTKEGGAFKGLEPRSVHSEKLDQITKAGPANEILRDVLGVPITIPDWSVEELEGIIDEFAQKELTADTLKVLRARLKEAGLSEFYPQAIVRVSNDKTD